MISEVGRIKFGASADHNFVIANVFVPGSAARTTDAAHSMTPALQKNSSLGGIAQPAPLEISSESEIRNDAEASSPRASDSLGRAARPDCLEGRSQSERSSGAETVSSRESDSRQSRITSLA